MAAGANPDAPNYCGVTAREWASHFGDKCFDQVPVRSASLPACRILNAELLAEQRHLRLKIPERAERELMQVGQAVALYIYGPPAEPSQARVKVRITAIAGNPQGMRYAGRLETVTKHNPAGADTAVPDFGPEHIASVYVTRPAGKTVRTKRKG